MVANSPRSSCFLGHRLRDTTSDSQGLYQGTAERRAFVVSAPPEGSTSFESGVDPLRRPDTNTQSSP